MIGDRCSDTFHHIRSSCSIIAAPIQYVVSLPIDIINWVATDISSQQRLVNENVNFRAQLLLLKAKLEKQYAIETENKQLHALLQTSLETEGRVLEARLLAITPDPFVRQIVLNRGKINGLYVGQPVIDTFGVMGQIVQVGPLTSRVMLLTDPQSSIPVEVGRNGIRAIAVGDSALDMIKLQHVTITTDIQKDDIILTSGLGQRYPYGYPVGKVVSVENRPGEQFADIRVMPSAHLNQSRLVLVLWPKV